MLLAPRKEVRTGARTAERDREREREVHEELAPRTGQDWLQANAWKDRVHMIQTLAGV